MVIYQEQWLESLADLARDLDFADHSVEAYIIYDWILRRRPRFQNLRRLRKRSIERMLNQAPALANPENPLNTRLHSELSIDARMLSCAIRHSTVEALNCLREPIAGIADPSLQLPLLMSLHGRTQQWDQWIDHLRAFLHHHRLSSHAELKTTSILDEESVLSRLTMPPGTHANQSSWTETLVSVVLTAHNAANTLNYSVASILNQSHVNLELIAINDASNDDTAERLEALASLDPRIKVIHNTQRLGTYASRNKGLLSAGGDFIANHDADDFAHPDRLNQQLRCFHHHAEAPAVLGQWLRISADGQVNYHNRRGGSFLHGALATIMLRRDAINRIGFYDAVLCSADTEYLFRIRRVWGHKSIPVIRRPLVLAASLGSGLSSDPYLGTDSFLGDSPPRREYRQAWETWHEITPASDLYLGAETKERAFPAPSELLKFSCA